MARILEILVHVMGFSFDMQVWSSDPAHHQDCFRAILEMEHDKCLAAYTLLYVVKLSTSPEMYFGIAYGIPHQYMPQACVVLVVPHTQ